MKTFDINNIIDDVQTPWNGIVIAGKQRSGKTTTAEALARELEKSGTNTQVIPFAEALKDAVSRTLNGLHETGVVPNNPDDYAKQDIRPAYQAIGQGLRNHYKDIWVDIWLHKAANTDFAINDDCRYPNEVHNVNRQGYFTILLDASRVLREQRGELTGETHESETSIDNVDTRNFHAVMDMDTNPNAPPKHIAQRILIEMANMNGNGRTENIIEPPTRE